MFHLFCEYDNTALKLTYSIRNSRGEDSAMTVKNIADLIQSILEKHKGFMTVTGLAAMMKADEKRAIGIRNNDSGKIISRKIEKSAEGRFIFRNKGRSVYILVPSEPSEFVLDMLSEKRAFDTKMIQSLPFTKSEFVAIINALAEEGRVIIRLTDDMKPKIFRASNVRRADEVHDVNDSGEYTQERFKAAFDELDRGKIFVRICDLRRRLGWPREVFDGMIRDLRNRRVIQLHTGDASLMTPDEVSDCYIDENNFRMGSVTWHDGQ